MPSGRSLAASATLAVLALSAPVAEGATLRLPDAAHLRLTGPLLRQSEFRLDVAAAGDFNGDGLGDVVVGAPGADPLGRHDAGSAFVVFGRRGAPATVDPERMGEGGLRIDGRAPVVPVEDEEGLIGEGLGTAVSGLGDVNGDGLDDLALSAPRASHGGDRLLSGAAYVVYGRRGGGALDLEQLGGAGFRIDGGREHDVFGERLAGLAGRDPAVAVGADERVDVVPATAPPGSVVDLAQPAAGARVITGYDRGDFNPFYADFSLRALEPAGDVDGDGRGDLLIGQGNTDVEGVEPDESAYESSAFVVFGGGAAALPRFGGAVLRLDGVAGPVAALGDLVGDRRDDVIVAGVRARTFLGGGGGPVVVAGRGAGRVDLLRPSRGLRHFPLRPDDWTVARVDTGFAFGNPRRGRRESGRVHVFARRALGRRRARPAVTLLGPRQGAIGTALTTAGDVDGDRRADLVVAGAREVFVVTARRLRR